MMTYGSVCSGIEAASVAWLPLGWNCAWVSEIDAFPSAVLAHHYPEVSNLGDFTQIRNRWLTKAGIKPIDLLVGGTPCQDFSVAGLRAGLDGERGNLTLEFLRLARRLRPRWLVWENVPGVFSSLAHDSPDSRPPAIDLGGPDGPEDGQEVVVEDEYESDERHAFGCFLAGLSELGYGFAYRILDAQYAGVPQRRRRVFVVGYSGKRDGVAGSASPQDIARFSRISSAVLFERYGLSGHIAPRREARSNATHSPAGSPGSRGNDAPRHGASHPVHDIVGSLDARSSAGGFPGSDGACGGHLIPEMWSGAEPRPLTASMQRYDGETEELILAPTLFASNGGASSGYAPMVPVARHCDESVKAQPYNIIGLGQNGPNHAYPTETSGCLQSKGLSASGNEAGTLIHVTPIQEVGKRTGLSTADVRAGIGIGTSGDPMFTLQAGAQHGVAIAFRERGRDGGRNIEFQENQSYALRAINGGGCGDWMRIAAQSAVRRLTPTECERLMGFPDGYTLIPYRGKPACDGPRYKALGNSIVTQCLTWIGKRIELVESILAQNTEVA